MVKTSTCSLYGLLFKTLNKGGESLSSLSCIHCGSSRRLIDSPISSVTDTRRRSSACGCGPVPLARKTPNSVCHIWTRNVQDDVVCPGNAGL